MTDFFKIRTTVEFLTLAKALIENEKRWGMGMNFSGVVFMPFNTETLNRQALLSGNYCMCSQGAALFLNIILTGSFYTGRLETEALRYLNEAAKEESKGDEDCETIVLFNDRHPGGHDAVMRVWNLAIAMAKRNEG
jgi:hypothetical protein